MAKNIKPYFFGAVVGGKVKFDDLPKMRHYLQQFEGKEIRLTIERKPKQQRLRSNQENRYYWGVVLPILGDHCGLTPEEMHETLKAQFLSEDREIKGYTLKIIRSTADLTVAEFEEYLSTVRMFASIELGVFIPLPNEVAY